MTHKTIGIFIDLGHKLGISICDLSDKLKMKILAYDYVNLPRVLTDIHNIVECERRLKFIINKYVKEFKVNILCYEVILNKYIGSYSFLSLNRYATILLLVCGKKRNIKKIYSLSPNTVKSLFFKDKINDEITIYNCLTKHSMLNLINKFYKLKIENENISDSIALAHVFFNLSKNRRLQYESIL